MEGLRFALIALFIVFVAAGCRQPANLPYEHWAEPESAYSPPSSSDNAFDSYALAASDVELTCGKYIDRNYFTPAMKQACIDLMQGALARLQSAAGRKCLFQFRAHKPGQRPTYQKGWRLLGRALVWQIEQGVLDGDYGSAVRRTNEAIAFGFDLVGGGALDASLGLTIVDEARAAIAPAIMRMSPEQLASLQDGVTTALLSRPLLSQALENERKNMLAAVDFVQDAFRDQRWQDLQGIMDRDARPAIQYLKELRAQDPSKRASYFASFASEAKSEVEWLIDQSKIPAYKRTDIGPEDKDAERPWKRFSKHFFMTGRPLLGQELKTLARTRLLVLHAAALRQVRANKDALANLDSFPIMIRTDPYSGNDFIYRGQGADFRIYSVGLDCRDDGGESDETFTAPDLLLELSR